CGIGDRKMQKTILATLYTTSVNADGKTANDWGFRPYGKNETALKPGDLVRVFKTVSSGKIAWEGTIDLDCSKLNRGVQRNTNAKKWMDLFYQGLPAKMQSGDHAIFGSLEPFCE